MTMQDRLAKLEDLYVLLGNCVVTLTEVSGRQQTLLERMEEHLEELRRDANQTQRLWAHLAKKYGWLDDGDWPSQ
jgi:hypothetical protein